MPSCASDPCTTFPNSSNPTPCSTPHELHLANSCTAPEKFPVSHPTQISIWHLHFHHHLMNFSVERKIRRFSSYPNGSIRTDGIHSRPGLKIEDCWEICLVGSSNFHPAPSWIQSGVGSSKHERGRTQERVVWYMTLRRLIERSSLGLQGISRHLKPKPLTSISNTTTCGEPAGYHILTHILTCTYIYM